MRELLPCLAGTTSGPQYEVARTRISAQLFLIARGGILAGLEVEYRQGAEYGQG